MKRLVRFVFVSGLYCKQRGLPVYTVPLWPMDAAAECTMAMDVIVAASDTHAAVQSKLPSCPPF